MSNLDKYHDTHVETPESLASATENAELEEGTTVSDSNENNNAEETAASVENDPPASVTVEGIVTDCMALNIRTAPSMDADIVGTVDVLTEVVVDLDKSVGEWYNVFTEAGMEGFCKKDFIAVKTAQ